MYRTNNIIKIIMSVMLVTQCAFILVGQESTPINISINSYSHQELMDNFPRLDNKAKTKIDGEILYLYGNVVFQDGQAAVNHKVEIWQTDREGIYDHPFSFKTKKRNKNFQFYGSTITDSQGRYNFRTIIPGEYNPRPRHIHFKVKKGKKTVLTSQFYFDEDIEKVEEESMVKRIDKNLGAILLTLAEDENHFFSVGNIVIKGGASTEFLLTPSQAEGPYYPRKNLDLYNNDLVFVNR